MSRPTLEDIARDCLWHDFTTATPWARLRCAIWRALEWLSPDRYSTGLDVTGDRVVAFLIRTDPDGTCTVLDELP